MQRNAILFAVTAAAVFVSSAFAAPIEPPTWVRNADPLATATYQISLKNRYSIENSKLALGPLWAQTFWAQPSGLWNRRYAELDAAVLPHTLRRVVGCDWPRFAKAFRRHAR